MVINMPLSALLVIVALMTGTSGLKWWKGCHIDVTGKFKFKLSADLEGDPFESFTFLRAGNELSTECSVASQQITGSGTAANPYSVEIVVDPLVDINLGNPDCGHVATAHNLTWTAKIGHTVPPPVPFAAGWSDIQDFTCDFDNVPDPSLCIPFGPNSGGNQGPSFQHICNQNENGYLFLAVWITVPSVEPIEYIAFLDTNGQGLFSSCATSGNPPAITGGTIGNPYFIEISVNTSVSLDVGVPDCGLVRNGNNLTWRVEVQQQTNLQTIEEFTCVYTPPPLTTPPQSLPPSPTPPGPTPPESTSPPTSSGVIFQHQCSQLNENLFLTVWIPVPSVVPIEYIAFLDTNGQGLFTGCSTSGNPPAITGGTIGDPYFIEIAVNTSVSLDVGVPDCGLVRNGNNLTWRVEVLQLPTLTTIEEFTCVYTPPPLTTLPQSLPPPPTPPGPTPPESTSPPTPSGVIFQWVCQRERGLFVFKLLIDLNSMPMTAIAFRSPTGQALDCECGTAGGHFTGNGTEAHPYSIRVQVSPTCDINYGTPACGHIAIGNVLVWTVAIVHTPGSPETQQQFSCNYDSIQEDSAAVYPI